MFEIEDFPKCHAEIQQAQTGDCSAHPARSHEALQTVESRFTSGVEEKVVVAPIAQPQKALRNPWQERENYANFQAKNDVEDNAKFGRHQKVDSSQSSVVRCS